MFGEMGFRAATIREIASRLGMTDSAVRYHFGGKESLLLEVVKQKEAEDREFFKDAYLRELVAANAGRQEAVRLFTTLSAEATDPQHPAHEYFVERYEGIRRELIELLSKDRPVGEDAGGDTSEGAREALAVEHAARITIAVIDGLQVQWLLGPAFDMSATYDFFLERFFGIADGDEAAHDGDEAAHDGQAGSV